MTIDRIEDRGASRSAIDHRGASRSAIDHRGASRSAIDHPGASRSAIDHPGASRFAIGSRPGHSGALSNHTLREAAGQASPPAAPQRRPGVIVGGIVGGVLAAAVLWRASDAPQEAVSEAASEADQPAVHLAALRSEPRAARRVRLIIESLPAGAQVLHDGQQLGVTPWQAERAAGAGSLDVVLRLRGYRDRPLHLVLDSDHTERLILQGVRSAVRRRAQRTASR